MLARPAGGRIMVFVVATDGPRAVVARPVMSALKIPPGVEAWRPGGVAAAVRNGSEEPAAVRG